MSETSSYTQRLAAARGVNDTPDMHGFTAEQVETMPAQVERMMATAEDRGAK